jgi:hypothetical protein
MKKKTATIVDKPVVWKNLKELKGESFLLEMKPKFKGCDERKCSGRLKVGCAKP